MPDTFDLPLHYNGEDITFPAELQAFGYSHRIKVTIQDIEFHFEPDDEKNYRAIVPEEFRSKAEKIDRLLLQAVAQTLEELFSK